MKIGLLGFLIILSFSCKTTHNNFRENLDNTFDSYINSKNFGDYEKLTKLMPKEMFEIYPKDSVIAWFRRAEQQVGFVKIKNYKIIDYGQLLHTNNKIYSKIKYEASAIIESNKPYNDLVFKYLRREFGEKNVKFDNSLNLYLVDQLTIYTIAIGENHGQSWKFMEYTPNSENIVSLIIPPDVWRKLK
jgi:hypothetical protein